MDFFNKIYNSEYFVIGLFVIIGILLILFVLLILSGKKEQKENGKLSSKDEAMDKNLETINNVNLTDFSVSEQNDTVKNNQAEAFKQLDNKEKLEQNLADSIKTVEALEEKAQEQQSQELFNTSIFHDMPQQVAAMSEQNSALEEKSEENSLTANLFEPLPDLDKIAQMRNDDKEVFKESPKDNLNFGMPTFDKPVFEPPVFVKQEEKGTEPAFSMPTINKEAKPDLPSLTSDNKTEDSVKSQHLQFSSVYVNNPAEVSKSVEDALVKEKKEHKPYDPSLFTSYVKKEEPKKEIDLDKTITNMHIPKVTPVPPLPENPAPATNRTFSFDLPTLAKEEPNDSKKDSQQELPGFPSFINETYDVNK